MSILTTDLRNKRHQFLYAPSYRTVAHYCTDTTKSNVMKDSLSEEFLFGNLRPFPDLLKKNLADTLVNQQQSQNPEMASTKDIKLVNNDYSKLSGIANFISGVFSVVSSVMFKRPKSPVNCFEDDEMAHPENWHYSNSDYKNEFGQSVDVSKLNLPGMPDYKTVAASCEDKLNNIRQLLPGRNSQHQTITWLRHPKRQFIEEGLVEDCFEDALSLEECFCLPENSYIEYFSPPQYQKQELYEADAPKTKVEGKLISESFTSYDNSPKLVLEDPKLNYVTENNKLIESCEDKMSKLKAFLQQKCKNKTKSLLETSYKDSTQLKPTKSIPIANSKNKRYKNPNRLCSKRVKTNMKQIIEDEMLFANEVNLDDFSSVEDSPSFHSLEKWSESPQSNNTPQDYFDEISGRFQAGSAASSNDSFQIVFSDVPQRCRTTSDCDSEDSFIVFEDSPDSCYTSNDVFCDSDDGSDSDSDMSDSGCGNMKLSQSLSRTVSNLTDDSLYDEIDSVNNVPSSVFFNKEESKSGLLMDECKKSAKKEVPVKKVRFSPLPPKVHVMHVWAFAARQARAGHWEQYALDRERFRRRIADVDLALDWILKPQHRSRIMFQRFMPWWNAQKRKELAEEKEKEEAEKTRREAAETEELEKTVVIEEIIEETQENNEEHGNEETLEELQDKELKSDNAGNDSFKLEEDSKQREIITNNTNNSLDEGIERCKKEGKTKSYKNTQGDNKNFNAKLENKLLHDQDRDERGIDVVRDADKRILKSNGI